MYKRQHQDPGFPGNSSNAHDIGVIDFTGWAVTPADVWTFTPATLPTAGQLDQIGARTLDALPWWVVGYGTEEAARGPGGQTHPGGGVRMKAAVGFNALNKTWVRLAMNESRGFGGACYGDSGGPNIVTVGGREVVGAITRHLNAGFDCETTLWSYRLDTPAARAFLSQFLTPP